MSRAENSRGPGETKRRHPSEELSRAMTEALNGNANPSAAELLDAADNLLENVLATNCESRSSALPLLTVDALITRAMEIAVDNPAAMARLPEEALRRISAHAR